MSQNLLDYKFWCVLFFYETGGDHTRRKIWKYTCCFEPPLALTSLNSQFKPMTGLEILASKSRLIHQLEYGLCSTPAEFKGFNDDDVDDDDEI